MANSDSSSDYECGMNSSYSSDSSSDCECGMNSSYSTTLSTITRPSQPVSSHADFLKTIQSETRGYGQKKLIQGDIPTIYWGHSLIITNK